ncbi:MAG TPA: dephospho-CoA kinase [Candidatus Limnocylindrales bacterium]|nr:dephospho-CoA kinase [Candidatus Limnocylindrales bacterium]
MSASGDVTERHRAVRIGITGPIGCGKSTIAGWRGKRPGVVVIDADRVARDVLGRGEPAVEAVVARFGADLLRDGELDRAALGRLVFDDPAALRDLEAIVHPAVRPRIMSAIAEADRARASAIVIEAIKLVEGGLAAECDEVWLVRCDPEVQRDRLIGRGSAPGDAAQRIAAQEGAEARMAGAATLVIDTSGDEGATRLNVDSALEDAMSRRSRPG